MTNHKMVAISRLQEAAIWARVFGKEAERASLGQKSDWQHAAKQLAAILKAIEEGVVEGPQPEQLTLEGVYGTKEIK